MLTSVDISATHCKRTFDIALKKKKMPSSTFDDVGSFMDLILFFFFNFQSTIKFQIGPPKGSSCLNFLSISSINVLIVVALHTILLFSLLVPLMQTTALLQFISNKLLFLLPDTYNTSLSLSSARVFCPWQDLPCTRCSGKTHVKAFIK